MAPDAWKNVKTQALFKILAGERGRIFSVDELIEYLWPEEERNLQSAASNLRTRIAELRRILEPGLALKESSCYIETRHGGYVLDAKADCWIDTEEFARCEEAGRRCQREGQLEDAIILYERAVALYRGDYLAEDRYAEWVLQLQARWRERYVEILSELADALAQRGRYREAIRSVERAVQSSPLHETLYRQWMVYAHCAGEAAQARRAYERCREVLERELGERPSSRTEEIYRQIQQGQLLEIAGRYPVIAQKSPSLQLHRLPFCGRRSEWQQLNSALQKAQDGHGVLALISGEPGVGKTRLSEEFFAQAQEKFQAHVLKGRCLELKSPLPLHPWLEALHPAVAQLTPESLGHLHRSWLAECAELLPALHNAIPQLPQDVTLPSEHRPYRLFETLYQILCALARLNGPLLILLDDLQWADEDTLDFICYLIDRWSGPPLMLLGTLRAQAQARELRLATLKDHALRRQCLEEIQLRRLTAADIQELIARIGHKLETPPDAGERLYHESAGNPLFLSTILQSFFENGIFVTDGAHWQLRLPHEIHLPAQVLQLIEHRIARVGPAAQRLLQMIACAVQIELGVLEQAWEGTTEELFVHLNDLIAQGILTEHQGRYEFSHDKYREAVYSALEEPRKIWLHRRLAQALENVYAEPAALGLGARLAEHYERGGQPQRALEWTLKTIALCNKHYQNREGLELASRGLAIIEQAKGRFSEREWKEKQLELMLEHMGFLIELGQIKPAQNDIDELLRLITEDSHRAKVLLRQAYIHRRLGHYSESLQSAQDAYLLSQQLQDREMLQDSLSEIGLTYFFMGKYQQALEHLEQALNLARSAKHLGHEAYLLTNYANALTKLGHFQTALSHYKSALQIRQDMKDLKASDVLNNIGAVLRYLGDYQQALNYLEQACHTDRETGNRFGLGFSLCNLAQIYRLLGQYDQAQSLSKEALHCFVELEDLPGQAMMLRWQGILHREQQDLSQAQVCLGRALEIARALNAKSEEGESLLELGQTLTNQQKLEESLKHLQQALAIAQTLQIPYLAARCWMALSKLLTIQKLLPDALTAATEAMQLLTQHKWSGEFALQAHFQHYRVLTALGRPETQDALRQAQEEVQKTAALITDVTLRHSFLQIPLHQKILAHTPAR